MTSGSDFLRKMSLSLNEHKKDVEQKDNTKFTRQRKQSVDEQQNKSAITDHVVKENHVTGWDEASILGWEGNRSARCIWESIEIRKQDIQGHAMNRDAGTQCFIQAYFFFGGGGNFPPNFESPPRTWGEVCYYVNVIPVSLLSVQN